MRPSTGLHRMISPSSLHLSQRNEGSEFSKVSLSRSEYTHIHMETEHQPLEIEISAETSPAAITTAPLPELHSADPRTAVVAQVTNLPKRQRRPSVRLGEIGGDATYEALQRRPNKTWRYHKDPSSVAKASKTRPLTNLVNGGSGKVGGGEASYQDSVENTDNFADFSHRKPKIKKPAKRARTNWNKFENSTINNGGAVGGVAIIDSSNFLPEENDNNNDEFREFEAEGSGSPVLKEQESPINSGENMGLRFWDQHRRRNRARLSEGNGVHQNEVNSPDKRSVGIAAVMEWLTGLGLERYAPVFEIHEVNEEVLPMLTLEDLKDMGINAVGSRRRMYSSILKLRKGFS